MFFRRSICCVIVMLKTTPSSSVARSSGADLLECVAGTTPATLLPGEREADYANLVARIVAVAQPRDAIEEFLTSDIIALSWEIRRLRRLKAGILRASIGTRHKHGHGEPRSR